MIRKSLGAAIVALFCVSLVKADSTPLDTFTFQQFSFTINSTEATVGQFGPVFTVLIAGSPWTFALDEPQDYRYYTAWYGPGAIQAV